MDRFTTKADGETGVALTFDLDVSVPNMDEVEKLQSIIFRLAEYENTGLTPAECAELAQAKADGRVVVLPCRQDEIIHAINVALKITLYDWQIAYVFGASDYLMPGRRTGRTLAYILKLLLSDGEPIRIYKRSVVEQICDEYHGPQYFSWFKNYLRDIYYELSNPGLKLKLRKVFFTREAAEKALKECEK